MHGLLSHSLISDDMKPHLRWRTYIVSTELSRTYRSASCPCWWLSRDGSSRIIRGGRNPCICFNAGRPFRSSIASLISRRQRLSYLASSVSSLAVMLWPHIPYSSKRAFMRVRSLSRASGDLLVSPMYVCGRITQHMFAFVFLVFATVDIIVLYGM